MALLQQNTAPASPAPAEQAAVPARPASIERPMAGALRAVLADPAIGGEFGGVHVPSILADAATVLWTRFLTFDAADPHWPDRDRFIVSAEAAPLLCALLHLTGDDGFGIETAQRWRHPVLAGEDDRRSHPAIEPSLGPPGQALATGIGLALAERLLAERFGKSLVDHRTWVIASDADLIAGIGHEAASLAGRLKLNRIAVLWEAATHSGADEQPAPQSDDVAKRFASYGWAVRRVDGSDLVQVAAALSFAMRSRKPTLVACADLGMVAEPARIARRAKPVQPHAAIPDIVLTRWKAVGARGAARRRGWLKRAARHKMRAEFERAIAGRPPNGLRDAFAAWKCQLGDGGTAVAPGDAARRILASVLPLMPDVIGGAACLAGPDRALPDGGRGIGSGKDRGRSCRLALRDHGMAAAMTGMALHGGIVPCAGAALAFSDAIRPALRLAARTRKRMIHFLEHEAVGCGADGAAHQPAGHLASLRAVPNLHVYRPADAIETAECCELALHRADGPSLLVLTREPVPILRANTGRNLSARGGYVLAEAEGRRRATLIASGGEVALAMAARQGTGAAGDRRGRGVAALLGAARAAGRGLPGGRARRRAAHRHRGRARLRLGTLARRGRLVRRGARRRR